VFAATKAKQRFFLLVHMLQYVLLLKLYLNPDCQLEYVANDLDTVSAPISRYLDTSWDATVETAHFWQCTAPRLGSDLLEYEVYSIWVVRPQESALLLAR
jgi:hypothetical protein